jgi:ABC-type nitrate/sulfonate/bicarbonate transport system substrate-binding protein
MREKGIWSRFGIDLQARYIPSGEMDHASLDQHVREGKINLIFGYHHTPYVARAKKAAVSYTCVASISNQCPDVICSRPAIKSVKDLKGKRIAVQGYHPRSTVWRILALENISVEKGEVEFAESPARGTVYQGMLDQLIKGEVDAAFLQPPFDLRAQEAGFIALEETRLFPNIMGATLTMTPDFIKAQPESVKNLIKAMIYGTWFVKTNPEECISILTKAARDMEDKKAEDKYFRYAFDRQVQILESRPYPTTLAVYHIHAQAVYLHPDVPNLKELNPLSVWDTHWMQEIEDSGFIDNLYASRH